MSGRKGDKTDFVNTTSSGDDGPLVDYTGARHLYTLFIHTCYAMFYWFIIVHVDLYGMYNN